MTIKKIAQLGAGIFTDALRAESDHGLQYVDMNAHLLDMAARGEFEAGLIRPELIEAGVSPARQLLASAGITLGGLRASSCGVFFPGSPEYVPGANVLLPVLAQEAFESALGLHAAQDLSFTSRPGTPGDTVYPTDVRPMIDQRLAIPDQVVNTTDLVSITFGIDGDNYKTAQIKSSSRGAQNEFGRVAEGADLPLYSIQTAERSVNIFKYGGRVNWTYEAARRWRVNQLMVMLAELAFSEELRRRKAALEVAMNGDENGNGAILTVGTSLGIRSLDEWAMGVAYSSSLGLTMFAGDLPEVRDVRALRYGPGGSVLSPDQLAMYGSAYVMPDGSALRLAPAGSILQGSGVLLGWNPARALEQVIENGSQISETERNITNQTAELTQSINIGFGKPFDNSFQAFSVGAQSGT